MSFFRYPGGKSKLSTQIIDRIEKEIEKSPVPVEEYREPFFGGGSIGLKIVSGNFPIKKIWINDFDKAIASLWTCTIKFPKELIESVQGFTPSVEEFYSIKDTLEQPYSIISEEDVVKYGFKKLAIHQISYSGLGVKSGGPLGGREQKSDYKVDCRWSPDYICKKITKLNSTLAKYEFRDNKCSSVDFSNLIKDETYPAIIYLDPPYYVKGNELYQFGFTQNDHERLTEALRTTNHSWVLSYDDCPEIRRLYDWAQIEELVVNYSITGARQKTELLIYRK